MIFGNKNWPIIYVSVCIKRVKGPSLERLKLDKPSKDQGGLFGWRVPYIHALYNIWKLFAIYTKT